MAIRRCTGVVKSTGKGGKLASDRTQVARKGRPLTKAAKDFMMSEALAKATPLMGHCSVGQAKEPEG